MSRPDPLAAHIRRLGNHDLNELLVQLPKPVFAALAWVTPASRARWLALAAHVRALPDPELHTLLRALPREVFDGLLEAACPEGSAA